MTTTLPVEAAPAPTFTVAATSEPLAWSAGRDLLCDVAQVSGFPDTARWPRQALLARTLERQRRAESVWVAYDGHLNVIGHALLSPVSTSSSLFAFADVRAVTLELCSLAVHPAWQRRGVATALRDARVGHARELGVPVELVTAARPGGPSDRWYARHWELLGQGAGTLEPVVNVYRHPCVQGVPRGQ